MKQDADFFEGKEAALLYIAKKLKEALALEQVLTAAPGWTTASSRTAIGEASSSSPSASARSFTCCPNQRTAPGPCWSSAATAPIQSCGRKSRNRNRELQRRDREGADLKDRPQTLYLS